MLTDAFGLAASYRRRALYTTIGATLLGACLLAPQLDANAQTSPPPAVPGTAAQPSQPTPPKKKPAAASLKVVPLPRTRAAEQQAPAGGDPANPQAGSGTQGGRQGAGAGGAGSGVPGGGVSGAGQGGFGAFGQGRQGQRPRTGGDLSGFSGMFGPGGAGRGTTFQFEFHGADITNVLKLFSGMSGLTITADPGVAGPVTIINNAKPVTLDEAFKILQSVLKVRGYTAQQNGSVLEIIPIPYAIKSSTIVSVDPETGLIDPRDQVMTQIIPLENVDATQMAKDLLPLVGAQASIIGSAGTNSLIVTDSSSSVKRIIALINALDKTSSRTELKVYPLRHAEATNVAQTISDLYKQITPRSSGAPQPGGPQNFQIPQQPGQAAPGGVNARPAVIAVADNRTNSVLVVASPDNQESIARDIISRLDDDDSALETEVIKVKYSNSQDVANLVNTVLSNQHSTPQQSNGGGGRNFGGFNPFGGFGGFGGGQNSTTTPSNDPFGQVTADPRTNSLFVTANSERMARIKELIKQIDVDVPVETTTFVIPLKNAKAEDVAYALSQAFRTTNSNSGNTGFGGFFGGGGNQQSRPGQNGTNSRQNGRGGAGSTLPGVGARTNGRSVPPPPNAPDGGDGSDPSAQNNGGSAIPQGVAGVMTDQGFVPMDTNAIKAAQESGKTGAQTRQIFGGFGGGRRQGVGQTGQPQYGRGNNGTYSNLLQLQDNVFVTPSPDGESLIVTTTPDNYRALQGIVNQLDVIPKQVMVEVIVAEVTLDSDQKFGFNLSGMLFKLFGAHTNLAGAINHPANGSGPSSTAIDAAQTGSQFLLNGTNYSAIIQALNTDNKVKVMSTPRIFTSNAQQATIDINTYVPYINGQTSNGAVTGSALVSNTVQYLPIGVTITVTPRITRDGRVTMDLTEDLSDLISFDQLNTGQGSIRAPRYNLRHADTSVTVLDGQTVVVGGLIRDSEILTTSKVPLLGDVPLLGQFFRSREKTHNKVELVFFATPHVVDTDDKSRAITKEMGAPVTKQLPGLQKARPELVPTMPGKDKDKDKDKPNVAPGNSGKTPDINAPTTPLTPPN